MKYMGSKTRLAKYILPILLADRKDGQTWVEPFVGGGNLIDKVGGPRIGADINPYTVQALTSIRDSVSELPKNAQDFTESDYKKLRTDDSYPHKGYAGFALSYGGKWLGGWRRDGAGVRDYVAEAYRNAVAQAEKLKGVELLCTSYDALQIPYQSLLYCDPPYANSTAYAVGAFDHKAFWAWCSFMGASGHTVFVSEYSAPAGFTCVFEKSFTSSLTKDTGSKTGIEKLFKYTGVKIDFKTRRFL